MDELNKALDISALIERFFIQSVFSVATGIQKINGRDSRSTDCGNDIVTYYSAPVTE